LIIVTIGVTTETTNEKYKCIVFRKKKQRSHHHGVLWKTMKKPKIRKWSAKSN